MTAQSMCDTALSNKEGNNNQGQVTTDGAPSDMEISESEGHSDTNVDSAGAAPSSADVSVEENRAQYYEDLSETVGESKKLQDGKETTEAETDRQQGETVAVTEERDSHSSSNSDTTEACIVNEKKEDTKEFNSFLYWRTPLPEVDVTITTPVVPPQGVAKSMTALDDIHNDQTATKTQSATIVGDGEAGRDLAANLASLDIGMSGGDAPQLKDAAKPPNVVVHTASLITTEEEPTETVAHFGTTHVLGEHVGELAMKVIDGVVQGGCSSVSSVKYEFLFVSNFVCHPET